MIYPFKFENIVYSPADNSTSFIFDLFLSRPIVLTLIRFSPRVGFLDVLKNIEF